MIKCELVRRIAVQSNTRRSTLLRTTRFGDRRRKTLSWRRRTRISACNAAREGITRLAHQINPQRSGRLSTDSLGDVSRFRFPVGTPVCRGATTVSRMEPHAHERWEIHTYTYPKCGPSRTRVVPPTAAPSEAA
jgi:hypothetical protein